MTRVSRVGRRGIPREHGGAPLRGTTGGHWGRREETLEDAGGTTRGPQRTLEGITGGTSLGDARRHWRAPLRPRPGHPSASLGHITRRQAPKGAGGLFHRKRFSHSSPITSRFSSSLMPSRIFRHARCDVCGGDRILA